MALGGDFEMVLAAARVGNGHAIGLLFREHHPPLLRYLRAREPQAADDIAAEVWHGALRNLTGFSGDETGFRAWLFTIARRRLGDHRRTMGRRREVLVESSDIDRPMAGSDPAEAFATMQADDAARALVAGLPADQAEAVLLRVVGDLPVAEVARIMKRSEGAVRVLQHRALQRLAQRHAQRSAAREL